MVYVMIEGFEGIFWKVVEKSKFVILRVNKGVLWVKCKVFYFLVWLYGSHRLFLPLFMTLFLRLEFSFSWDQSGFSAISGAFWRSSVIFEDQDQDALFWDWWAFFNFRWRLFMIKALPTFSFTILFFRSFSKDQVF